MRWIVALLMVLSGVASADLGPPPSASCDVPQTCRACAFVPRADGGGNEEAPAGCVAEVQDAGFESFNCNEVSDAGTRTFFFCPPDADPTPKTGCSVAGVPLALLAVFGAWRTRKKS